MTRLESNLKLGPFILDAQTVVLEDYLEVAPENKERLEKLIRLGRVQLGPWYSQTDFLTVCAESITRNLLLGMQDSERFGGAMKVGYVPDSFGQSEQLPLFLRQFNIDQAVLWRGWSERLVETSEFNWSSPDGSQVTTAVFPWGYGCAKWLPSEPAQLSETLLEKTRQQCRFAATEHTMLPNGNDQSPFEYQVPGLLDAVNQTQDEFHFINSSFEHYFDKLPRDLPEFCGEMLDAKYMRIHRGIFSTRMDIKQANARLETLVSRYLEPLLALNYHNGLPYPQTAVNNIWREAMKSHAHDSIGGCNSDRVNSMVLNRLLSGIESANQLLELNFRQLADGIKASVEGTKVVVFNSTPKPIDSLVELTFYTPAACFAVKDQQGNELCYQILSESQQDMSTIIQELSNSTTTTWYRKVTLVVDVKAIPSCGYTTIFLQQGEEPSRAHSLRSGQHNQISNRWFSLRYEQDGTLTLEDHRTNQQYRNVFELVDGSDEGDNYNFSPLANDWQLSSHDVEHQVETSCGDLLSTLKMSYQLPVPADLEERKLGKASAVLPVRLTLTLRNDRPSLDAKVELENQACDHRIQLRFPTGVIADTHFADQPFGLIERANTPPEMAQWQQEAWTEAPVAIYPMQSLVILKDRSRGLGIITKGLREYEILAEQTDTLAITLMRSVGWLGQANLTYRPGRASGMVLPSPNSQLIGHHSFELSLVPYNPDEDADFWAVTEAVNTPVMAHVATDWARFRLNKQSAEFPESQSLVEWQTGLHFSTLKKAESGDGLVLRMFNPTRNAMPTGAAKSDLAFHSVQLDECSEAKLELQCAPCRPVTLKFEN